VAAGVVALVGHRAFLEQSMIRVLQAYSLGASSRAQPHVEAAPWGHS